MKKSLLTELYDAYPVVSVYDSSQVDPAIRLDKKVQRRNFKAMPTDQKRAANTVLRLKDSMTNDYRFNEITYLLSNAENQKVPGIAKAKESFVKVQKSAQKAYEEYKEKREEFLDAMTDSLQPVVDRLYRTLNSGAEWK
jgi:hypothetical protein